jgi:hypothetical protein
VAVGGKSVRVSHTASSIAETTLFGMTEHALGRPSVTLPYLHTPPPWVTHLTEQQLADRIYWLTTFVGTLATLSTISIIAACLKAALSRAVRRRQPTATPDHPRSPLVEPSRPPQRRSCVICLAESRRRPTGPLRWPALTAFDVHPVCGRPTCYLILVAMPSAAGFPRR